MTYVVYQEKRKKLYLNGKRVKIMPRGMTFGQLKQLTWSEVKQKTWAEIKGG